MGAETKTILLVDDHPTTRLGLKALIDTEPDFDVVGEAVDGREAIDKVSELTPDIVIIDVSMPRLNGPEATRKILELHPETKVLALSMHTEKKYVSEMLKSGASAYLNKASGSDELITAINSVLSGQVYLARDIMGTVVEDYVDQLNRAEPDLTPRELEIVKLLAEGKANKEIAWSLNLSVKTIETHRSNIMNKLNLSNVADLIKYAIRQGIVSID